MPDLGLEVLLKGKNMMRLIGGLGTALKISLISVVVSIPLTSLSGIYSDYATDGAAVPGLFWKHQGIRMGSVR